MPPGEGRSGLGNVKAEHQWVIAMKRSLMVLLLVVTYCQPVLAQTSKAKSRQQQADRARCRNGVAVGGVTGTLVSGRGLGNKLGGAAIGGAAGCIINKEWNRGK
jgi:hypothetical protein